MKRLDPLLRVALLAVLGLVVGLKLYSWNARTILGDPLPMPLGVGASVVLSGSMEPALSTGDLLILTRQDSYEVGDIVVFQSGSLSVVHRIVEIDGDRVITQGDANNVCDPPIPADSIRAEVAAAIPLAGYLLMVLKSPLVTAGMILGAAALLETSYRQEQRERRKENEKIKEQIRQLMKELEE